MLLSDRIHGRCLARALCAGALLLSGAASANVMNGDFSAGLTDWVSTGPTVSDGGGFALLENDGMSGLRGLEQTFGVPATGGTLSFDFHFTTAANSDNADDAFFVGLDAGGTFLSILVIDDSLGLMPDPDFPLFSTTPLSLSIVTGATTPIPGAPALGGTTHFGTLSLDLPMSLWGMDATLIFELTDGFSSFDTRAAVDNVNLSATLVPEPFLLLLVLGGMMTAVGCGRRARGD